MHLFIERSWYSLLGGQIPELIFYGPTAACTTSGTSITNSVSTSTLATTPASTPTPDNVSSTIPDATVTTTTILDGRHCGSTSTTASE